MTFSQFPAIDGELTPITSLPDAVELLIGYDARLGDAEKQALAELFRVAYSRFTIDDSRLTDIAIDNDARADVD